VQALSLKGDGESDEGDSTMKEFCFACGYEMKSSQDVVKLKVEIGRAERVAPHLLELQFHGGCAIDTGKELIRLGERTTE